MTSTELPAPSHRDGACLSEGRAGARSSAVSGPAALVAFVAFAALAASAAFCAGCGASSAAAHDEVFYLHGSAPMGPNATWETPFTPLDGAATPRLPATMGASVLGGDVKLSRPADWAIRDADYTEHRRFISYQSPRQFVFSIYERIDSSGDGWADLEKRYQADVKDEGSEILGASMPVATANAQGRSYLLRTQVTGKPAYQAFAHETLLRGDHRILLVQVVHAESTETIAEEASAAMRSLLVY